MIPVKKITSKAVGATKVTIQELCIANKKSPVKLYHVVGQVVKATVEEGSADMKDYIKLQGSFKAVNAITGEIFHSGVAIRPEVASNLIAGQLGDDSEGAPRFLKIALTITAMYDADSATSYVFGAEFFSENTASPFEELEALIPDLKKALPKPEAKAKK